MKKILMLISFSVLALAGNYLSIPLFFGVDFLFGSIAVMLAVEFLGIIPAVLVAGVGGLYTLSLWGHPYALIIFSIEAVFVGILYRNRLSNLMLADLAFWLIAGIPMVLFFYKTAIGLDWNGTLLIALKQPLNGIFNALIAGLIILFLHFRWKMSDNNSLRMGNILFHVMSTAILLAGAIPIIIASYSLKNNEEDFVHRTLMMEASHLLGQIQSESNADLKSWQQIMHWRGSDIDLNLILFDAEHKVLLRSGSSPKPITLEGENHSIGNNLNIWLPGGDLAAMKRWKQGHYWIEIPIKNVDGLSSIQAEMSSHSVVKRIESERQIQFYFLFAFVLISIVIARTISYFLTCPLKSLEHSSLELKKIISSTKPLTLPEFYILEYRTLGNALKNMSARLIDSFQELHKIQGELQTQVEDQTKELAMERQRLANIIHGTNVGTWEWNIQTGKTVFNERWAEIIGYTLEDINSSFFIV